MRTKARGATGPVDQRAVRQHNLGLVIRHVAQHGARSRARIAAETGLNKTTVSSLVAELIDRGLLCETGMDGAGAVASSRRGRRSGVRPRLGSRTGRFRLNEVGTDRRCRCDSRRASRYRIRVRDDFRGVCHRLEEPHRPRGHRSTHGGCGRRRIQRMAFSSQICRFRDTRRPRFRWSHRRLVGSACVSS